VDGLVICRLFSCSPDGPRDDALIRLTTTTPREHHITIPRHDALRVGTLAAILYDGGAAIGA
jgi:hypothetical protein